MTTGPRRWQPPGCDSSSSASASPQRSRSALDKLEEAIEGSIDRLRHLMFDLRPINLDRAQIAGGWWKMDSRPGSGTSISFWLPGVQQAPEFMLARLSP